VIRSFEACPDGLGRKPRGGDTERSEDVWD
jgi:hypothetical protein